MHSLTMVKNFLGSSHLPEAPTPQCKQFLDIIITICSYYNLYLTLSTLYYTMQVYGSTLDHSSVRRLLYC